MGSPLVLPPAIKEFRLLERPRAYRALEKPDASRRWKAFLSNHGEAIAAMDFFTVPTLRFSVLPGMTCPTCPITVKKALNKVDGVSKVEVPLLPNVGLLARKWPSLIRDLSAELVLCAECDPKKVLVGVAELRVGFQE